MNRLSFSLFFLWACFDLYSFDGIKFKTRFHDLLIQFGKEDSPEVKKYNEVPEVLMIERDTTVRVVGGTVCHKKTMLMTIDGRGMIADLKTERAMIYFPRVLTVVKENIKKIASCSILVGTSSTHHIGVLQTLAKESSLFLKVSVRDPMGLNQVNWNYFNDDDKKGYFGERAICAMNNLHEKPAGLMKTSQPSYRYYYIKQAPHRVQYRVANQRWRLASNKPELQTLDFFFVEGMTVHFNCTLAHFNVWAVDGTGLRLPPAFLD